jgi:hypothetical protein
MSNPQLPLHPEAEADAPSGIGRLNVRVVAVGLVGLVALAAAFFALSGDETTEDDATSQALEAGPGSTVPGLAALANPGADLGVFTETLEVDVPALTATVGDAAPTDTTLDASGAQGLSSEASADPSSPTTGGSDRPTNADDSTTTEAPAGTSSTVTPSTVAPTTRPPATEAPTTAAPTTRPPTTQPPQTTTQAPSPGNTCSSGAQFETVLYDDFNGSSLASHWIPYNSWGGFGTVDGVEGQRTPSAISVADGILTITGYGRDGRIETGGMENTVDLQYGRFSFRVRADNDPSQVYSGVLLTWPQSQNQYRDGENNIFETLVETPGRAPFFSFIHKPNGVASQQQYYRHDADGAQWQVMTMEWTPDRIVISRQGPGGSGSDSWVVNENGNDIIPDAPHHLTVQLDAWKSTPPANPVRLQVDWVEIARYCG